MDRRNKALRAAINKLPKDKLLVVLESCGLTKEEQRSLIDHKNGDDLCRISNSMNMSGRTTDRRRAAALNKLRQELER